MPTPTPTPTPMARGVDDEFDVVDNEPDAAADAVGEGVCEELAKPVADVELARPDVGMGEADEVTDVDVVDVVAVVVAVVVGACASLRTVG